MCTSELCAGRGWLDMGIGRWGLSHRGRGAVDGSKVEYESLDGGKDGKGWLP